MCVCMYVYIHDSSTYIYIMGDMMVDHVTDKGMNAKSHS
jgi:hypothetical protein